MPLPGNRSFAEMVEHVKRKQGVDDESARKIVGAIEQKIKKGKLQLKLMQLQANIYGDTEEQARARELITTVQKNRKLQKYMNTPEGRKANKLYVEKGIKINPKEHLKKQRMQGARVEEPTTRYNPKTPLLKQVPFGQKPSPNRAMADVLLREKVEKERKRRPGIKVKPAKPIQISYNEIMSAKKNDHLVSWYDTPLTKYASMKLVEDNGKFAKYWLLNAKDVNGNDWGVVPNSIARNIMTFINRPFVITAKKWINDSIYGDVYDHPHIPTNDMNLILRHQEHFRVANIVDVYERDGEWFASIERDPKYAHLNLPPFCSPAIYQLDALEHESALSKWTGLHLCGLDENPAYGARIAILRGTCDGPKGQCLHQLREAKQHEAIRLNKDEVEEVKRGLREEMKATNKSPLERDLMDKFWSNDSDAAKQLGVLGRTRDDKKFTEEERREYEEGEMSTRNLAHDFEAEDADINLSKRINPETPHDVYDRLKKIREGKIRLMKLRLAQLSPEEQKDINRRINEESKNLPPPPKPRRNINKPGYDSMGRKKSQTVADFRKKPFTAPGKTPKITGGFLRRRNILLSKHAAIFDEEIVNRLPRIRKKTQGPRPENRIDPLKLKEKLNKMARTKFRPTNRNIHISDKDFHESSSIDPRGLNMQRHNPNTPLVKEVPFPKENYELGTIDRFLNKRIKATNAFTKAVKENKLIRPVKPTQKEKRHIIQAKLDLLKNAILEPGTTFQEEKKVKRIKKKNYPKNIKQAAIFDTDDDVFKRVIGKPGIDRSDKANKERMYPLHKKELSYYDEAHAEGIPPIRVESFSKYPETKRPMEKDESGESFSEAINTERGSIFNLDDDLDSPLGEELEDKAIKRRLLKNRGQDETFGELFMRKFGPKGMRKENPDAIQRKIGTISLENARKMAKIKLSLIKLAIRQTFPKIADVNINPEHGRIIADAYDNMKHEPNNPDVKAAYGALISETSKQYEDLLKGGLKVTKVTDESNAYKNSAEMHRDVMENNHLNYFPTESGYGAGKEKQDHPILQPTKYKDPEGKPMLANDVFRVVHDINGHIRGEPSGFGPRGEHQAYLTHKQMFSSLANKALFSETAGQNNWVNFNKRSGEKNRKDPRNTEYAEQKAGLLPPNIIYGKWHQ